MMENAVNVNKRKMSVNGRDIKELEQLTKPL